MLSGEKAFIVFDDRYEYRSSSAMAMNGPSDVNVIYCRGSKLDSATATRCLSAMSKFHDGLSLNYEASLFSCLYRSYKIKGVTRLINPQFHTKLK